MTNFDLTPFIERIEQDKLNVEGIIINKDTMEIARHHFVPERRKNQYSISKSFTATAVGFAVAEGLLTLDDLVIDYLRDDIQMEQDAFRTLKIEHLLTMSLGQDKEYLMLTDRIEFLRDEVEDWVGYALKKPFIHNPGETFQYTNVGPYLAGVILNQITGMDLLDYLMPRLFEPLAIPRPAWEKDPQGRSFGAGGLEINVSELERFTRLYLQRGEWAGRQLLPEGWVERATRTHIMNDQEPADNHLGYGYLFWRSQHGAYRADGAKAQFGIVLEEKNTAIAINSDEARAQAVLDAVWETIYPKL